jgi:hypothetical protein
MLLPWLTLFDFANFRANFKKPIDLKKIRRQSYDFALLVPIFNDLKYLTNIEFLKLYSPHVILCTTTQETPEFIEAIENLAQEHGFRISYSPIEGTAKNPWAIYHKTLLAHDAVLKQTIHSITEKYVIFIDGDTYVADDLAILCGAMEQYKLDMASVKILPSRRKTIIEQLQGVEYDIAMRARLIYPWLTSGAGMVARKEVMNAVMENHSLFFNGGDIEIGKLAHLMGYKVGHIPMVFYTDIPSSFRKWVNQRRSWTCGMFRHAMVNIDLNLWHPFHFLYYSIVIYCLYPIKVLEILSHLYLLPLVILLYVTATFVANWKVRSRWMLIFPAYALFQTLVVVWLGFYRYVNTAHKTGNFGKIRVRNNPNLPFVRRGPWTMAKNFMAILVAVLAITLGAINSIQHIIFQRPSQVLDFTSVLGITQTFVWQLASFLRRGLAMFALSPAEVTGVMTIMLLLALVTWAVMGFFAPARPVRRLPAHARLIRARYRLTIAG